MPLLRSAPLARLDPAAAGAPDDEQGAGGRHHTGYGGYAPRSVLRAYACEQCAGAAWLGGRLGDSIRERQGMAYYVFSSLDANPLPDS